jgi:ribosome-associated protein
MEESLKDKSLHHASSGDATAIQTEPADVLDENLLGVLRAASDKKAVNPVVLDLREVADFTEFFVVTSGTNVRQVQAISDGIEEDLKLIDKRPVRIEGYNTAEWILMDYGDFLVHIFEEKAREFYDLERLWRDAKRVNIPADI